MVRRLGGGVGDAADHAQRDFIDVRNANLLPRENPLGAGRNGGGGVQLVRRHLQRPEKLLRAVRSRRAGVFPDVSGVRVSARGFSGVHARSPRCRHRKAASRSVWLQARRRDSAEERHLSRQLGIQRARDLRRERRNDDHAPDVLSL